jgi:hypothetical protein
MDFEIIYSYTREQAIADECLIDVSSTAAEAGFIHPVAITKAAHSKYVEWSEADTDGQTYQDEAGRLWDVLWVLKCALLRLKKLNAKPSNEIFYKLHVIPRDGRSRKPTIAELKVVIDGGDNGQAVLTIMLPNED